MAPVSLLSANLSTVAIESMLYGVFLLLTVASLTLTARRHSQTMVRVPRPLEPGLKQHLLFLASPMSMGTIGLFMFITAHWIITIFRLFDAFVNVNGGAAPVEYYVDLSETTEVVKTGFLGATLILSDSMIIYRLWIVWAHNHLVIIFPVLTLLGLTSTEACAFGVTYQFSQYTPGENVFSSDAGRWITSDCVFTLANNLYSTIMIAWRIWSTNKTASGAIATGNSLKSVLAMFIESAVVYTTWTIFFFACYQSGSNLQFVSVDCWAVMAGISFMMINVRVGLGWAQKSHMTSDRGASFSGARLQDSGGYRLRPLAVNIAQSVHHDTRTENDYELTVMRGHKDSLGKSSMSEV
ncbi:hypothetical protein C8J56DRAFT_1110143 [Mycena floridula]|nr:hypothetical protein C8J56DRAFT_1110143 [Mycena floridula]